MASSEPEKAQPDGRAVNTVTSTREETFAIQRHALAYLLDPDCIGGSCEARQPESQSLPTGREEKVLAVAQAAVSGQSADLANIVG